MFKAKGKLEIRKGVRIVITNLDLIRYYQKLFSFYTYKTVKSQLPMYGTHVSIYLPKIHGIVNTDVIKHLDGKEIEFEYDVENIRVTKKNIWMSVFCVEADEIKKQLNLVDKSFLGYHLTIANFKFENVST